MFETTMATYKEKEIKIIPILYNPKECNKPLYEEEVPYRLAMLRYFHANMENLMDHLCAAINGNDD